MRERKKSRVREREKDRVREVVVQTFLAISRNMLSTNLNV